MYPQSTPPRALRAHQLQARVRRRPDQRFCRMRFSTARGQGQCNTAEL